MHDEAINVAHRGRTTMPALFTLTPLTGDYEGNMEFMVLQVGPTPNRFPTNIL